MFVRCLCRGGDQVMEVVGRDWDVQVEGGVYVFADQSRPMLGPLDGHRLQGHSYYSSFGLSAGQRVGSKDNPVRATHRQEPSAHRTFVKQSVGAVLPEIKVMVGRKQVADAGNE